jgi:hypothetical protein
MAYQELLAEEIRRTEQDIQIGASAQLKDHLLAVRLYGDALAQTYLSDYSIRQLNRNPGSRPPHILGQRRAFDLALGSARLISQTGCPVIVADLTNIIRIGDVIVCYDPDTPSILECKSGRTKAARFERQGRRGRQIARMESIIRFLLEGRGKIFGETSERRTVTLNSPKQFNHNLVNEMVVNAIAGRPEARLLLPNELLGAARLGEQASGIDEAVRDWRLPEGTMIATGSSLDPLRGGSDIPPPVLWELSTDAKWALMEGNVTISHSLRVDAFVGMQRENARVLRVFDLGGDLRWGYEVLVGSETVTVNAVAVRDVLYRYETVYSAGARMLELAQECTAELHTDS